MNFCVHCLNCYCCSYYACVTSQLINNWQASQSCGLGCLFCYACCWTCCAPICIDSKCNSQIAKQNLIKGCKYISLACALNCVSPIDGYYNCFKTCSQICGQDKLVKTHDQIIKNSQFLGKSIKQKMGLNLQEQPLNLMKNIYRP